MSHVLSGWRTAWLTPQERAALEAGVAILGPGSRRPVAAQVCLPCMPLWREVHSLALRDYEWQLAKVAAVNQAEFERAASILDQQDEIRPRLDALLKCLHRADPSAQRGEECPHTV